jgi:hypothetical protein
MLMTAYAKCHFTQQRKNVLFVEPDLSLQLDVYESLRRVGANADLSCVPSCGAALSVISTSDVDVIVLSSNLCFDTLARSGLAALTAWANSRGVPLLAFTPPGFVLTDAQLCIPFHARIDSSDFASGAFEAALECAEARARLDHGLRALRDSARYR